MFAELALDLPLNSFYTYSVPEHLRESAVPGKRAVVSFGNRTVTGIITSLSEKTDIPDVKPLKMLLDSQPVIGEELMKFCRWISDYYIAPPGEVLFSCVPRAAGIHSVSKYVLAEISEATVQKHNFRSRAYGEILSVLGASNGQPLTLKQIERRTGLAKLKNYLDKLAEKKLITEVTAIDKPTQEKHTTLVTAVSDVSGLSETLKQNRLRSETYKNAIDFLLANGETELRELEAASGISHQQIRKLELLGLVTLHDQRVMREHTAGFEEEHKELTLNQHQQYALDEISSGIDIANYRAYLLHGVTGSGKTEVYINVSARCLESGKTAIILVPEISLTPQLLHRFKRVFREKVGVIHSKLSEGERLDTFDRIVSGEIRIVIGARSALFSPLSNLGLIVIDEEHDSSYKQDTSPRYNGRDAAVYRASLANAVVILGSATPSVESYYNAKTGKYKLITLPERIRESDLPEIKIVDLSDRGAFEPEEEEKDILDSIMKTRVRFLSKEMIFEIGKRLAQKESIIILQNRRGYHAYLECRACGNVETCERCSIALAYHKAIGKMTCHYCGFSRAYTGVCSKCSSTSITPKGAGTERVEEELQKLFPAAVTVRMDSDSLTSRKKYEKILRDFYEGKIDILTGTQIISKGLDFPNVTLVGVINADIGLLNPDFRSTEKTFQILTQVSGRSGRSVKKGEVLIQTNHPEYFVFRAVKNHDYEGFYEREIKMRRELSYPPFSRIALTEVKSEDAERTKKVAGQLFDFISKSDRKKLLILFPPVQPLFAKLKDKHRLHILVRSLKESDPAGSYMASVLRSAKEELKERNMSRCQVTIDVDAVNLM